MKTYDIIGIGIGPFNLGLAALCDNIPELKCLFIDKTDNFDWHTGMMIPGSKMQVPFYADLVTLADPCSRFSYLAYLKATGKLLRFGIHENYFITRREYNEYCQWVTSQLRSLQFNCYCDVIGQHEDYISVSTNMGTYRAKFVVIGVGTEPNLPKCAKLPESKGIHSSEYMFHRDAIFKQSSVTIIGSGQSAAEIFYDLLQFRSTFKGGIHWFTRSSRFYPMDYSKFSLEMSTPEYINYFYSLNPAVKAHLLRRHAVLYKGINSDLMQEIYETLHLHDVEGIDAPVALHPNCELFDVSYEDSMKLKFYHRELNENFTHTTSMVIFATGYKERECNFVKGLHLKPITRNYAIDDRIFVQNADLRSHGFNSADLSLGPYRNGIILNTILGRNTFTFGERNTYQEFGIARFSGN